MARVKSKHIPEFYNGLKQDTNKFTSEQKQGN